MNSNRVLERGRLFQLVDIETVSNFLNEDFRKAIIFTDDY